MANKNESLTLTALPTVLPPLRLPVGQDIFGTVIKQGLDFIDKTLFIKDVIDDQAAVILITRPRRFGKTLTLSMLHYFLTAVAFYQPTQGLFDGFKITTVDGGKYMQHQGKYPVVFVTFKGVKDHSFEHAYAAMRRLMCGVYMEHQYLLDSTKLSQKERTFFEAITDGTADQAQVKTALLELCGFLYKHHGVEPWLLIDEYDTPIQSSYVRGYYDEMINFMREVFGAALKTNPYIYKTVLTGILRVSKESLFSDLNNIAVYTTLADRYSQYFGFTEDEINYILQRNHLEDKAEEIKHWYNGYQFGKTIVYNPWSIVNCIKDEGKIAPYWINTSSNELIRDVLIKSSVKFKQAFESLLRNIPLQAQVDENVVYGDLERSEPAVWSMMLASGYLKATAVERIPKSSLLSCTLVIPNLEVETIYCQFIIQWLSGENDILWHNRFLEYLLSGAVPEFADYLKTVVLQIASVHASVHDMAREPEAFYQGLMLGLAASINQQQYEVQSNKESGYGRYDIMIIPLADHALTHPVIILELKSSAAVADLERDATDALVQIEQRKYITVAQQRGITNIVKIGIAFCGKAVAVRGS